MKYEKLLLLIFLFAIFILISCSLMPNYEYYEMTLVSNYINENGEEESVKVSGTTEHESLWWSEEDYRSTFIRKGYLIKSWNTKRDGSGRRVYYHDDNMKFREKNDGLVLYAQWTNELETPACSVFVVGDKNVRIVLEEKYKLGAIEMKVFRSTTNKENSFELIGVSDSFVYYDTDFTDIPATYYYKIKLNNDFYETEFSKSVPLLDELSFYAYFYKSPKGDYVRGSGYTCCLNGTTTNGYSPNYSNADMCVYRSVDSLSGYSKITCAESRNRDFYDSDLSSDTKYFYKVRAEMFSFISEFSSVISIETRNPGLQNVKIDSYVYDGDSVFITISWTPLSDANTAIKIIRAYEEFTNYGRFDPEKGTIVDTFVVRDTIQNYYGSSATLKYHKYEVQYNRFKVGTSSSAYTEAQTSGLLTKNSEVRNLNFVIENNEKYGDEFVVSWDNLEGATNYYTYADFGSTRISQITDSNSVSVFRQGYNYGYITITPFDSINGSVGKMSVLMLD